MRVLLFIFFLLLSYPALSQQTIRLNFLYGSKPAKGYKNAEAKHFGGLKGGHVNIEVNGRVLDFLPGNCPLFPHDKNPTGGFYINNRVSWDSMTVKSLSIYIPVSAAQMQLLEKTMDSFSRNTPYDYAVFGMRCAAASYDVLSRAGLVERLGASKNVWRNFYPKLLRKRMIKWALKNRYFIIRHEGRTSRKWESDKGPL